MAKAFSQRPTWQRWAMIAGWCLIGLVVIGVIVGPRNDRGGTQPVAAADTGAVREDFAKLAAPCEAAQLSVSGGLQNILGGDRVALAIDVRRMEDRCNSAWLSVGDIAEPAGLTDAQEEAFAAFTQACKLSLRARGRVAERLMAVVDGDLRPSVMADVEQEMAAMQGDVVRCSAALDALDPPPVSELAE